MSANRESGKACTRRYIVHISSHIPVTPYLSFRSSRLFLKVGYLRARFREKVGYDYLSYSDTLLLRCLVSSMKKKLEKESMEDGD